MYKNGLIRELRSISKFVSLQTGTQIITITILPDISKSKSNQQMEFGQLIEYIVKRNFFKIMKKMRRGY